MMKIAFNCPPQGPTDVGGLVFEWDQDAGQVAGPGAQTLRTMAARGWATYGPHPRAMWPLSAEPFKSAEDLAALVGEDWIVPPELLPHYPEIEDDTPEVSFTDAGGVFHPGRDQVRY